MTRRALAVLLFAATACAHLPAARTTRAVDDRLYCGLSIPSGGVVSEEEWRAFIAEVVTPRFPDGLTIWRAEGQWRGNDGAIVREPVVVIEVLHPATPAAEKSIREIAAAFRARFHQEAVMRVTTPADLAFE